LDMADDDSIFKSDDSKKVARAVFSGEYKGFLATNEKHRWTEWLRSGSVIQSRGHMCIIHPDGSLSFSVLGIWVEKIYGFPLVPANEQNRYEALSNACEAAGLIVEYLGNELLEDRQATKKRNLKIILFLADLNDA